MLRNTGCSQLYGSYTSNGNLCMYIVVNYINKWVSHEVWRIIDKSSVLICENKFGISTWISEYPVFYIPLNQGGYREESQSRWSEQKACRQSQGCHDEFEPGKALYSTPIFLTGCFLWEAYRNPKSRQGPGLQPLVTVNKKFLLYFYENPSKVLGY